MALSVKRAYVLFSAVFILSLFLYLYFIFASIYTTALRKNLQIATARLSSETAVLETEYMQKYRDLETYKSQLGLYEIPENEVVFANEERYLGRAGR